MVLKLHAACAAALFALTACDSQPELNLEGSGVGAQAKGEATTCDSSQHESASIEGVYTFDLDCALGYLASAGCDFTLDPDGDGRPIHSSVIEDLHNDAENCQAGIACSGCGDSDSLATTTTCTELAASSYFTEGAWADLQVACPASDSDEPAACTLEGVAFDGDELACAAQLFAGMSCEECTDLFDSRVCEDAINDPTACSMGSACTGCDDGDSRDNGVDCEEIAAYSYFGPSAAAALLDWVQGNPCDSACEPSCDSRDCGDDGCGGSCGSCDDVSTCDTSGMCQSEGGSIEGVYFDATELACAAWFFENMSCDECRELLDSRICEDAINTAATCQAGRACTGCSDTDSRADGVDADEIAAYSYFGAAAATDLLAFVQADGSCGAPDLVVEGVPMSTDDATAVLAVANGATLTELDESAGLDARAAANIVSARPVADIDVLAAVSYVGSSALELMLDYSAIWEPAEEEEEEEEEPVEEEEESCSLGVATSTDADATDLSRLLEIATTMDGPYAEVIAMQASGCTAWTSDTAAVDTMTIAIWDASFWWSWGEVPSSYLDISGPTAGYATFSSQLSQASNAIDDYTTDGHWDPGTHSEGAALLARRDELIAGLLAEAVADPSDFVEIDIAIDMSECSQQATAIIQLSTGAVLILHENSHC
jgi:hypothetical protein